MRRTVQEGCRKDALRELGKPGRRRHIVVTRRIERNERAAANGSVRGARQFTESSFGRSCFGHEL